MRTTALKMDYWKLAVATLALLAVIMTALLAPARLVAEERQPPSLSGVEKAGTALVHSMAGPPDAQRENSAPQVDDNKKVKELHLSRTNYLTEEHRPGLTLWWTEPQDTSTFISYDLRYRTKGPPAGTWTAYTGTISPVTYGRRHATIENLEYGTLYDVQVKGIGLSDEYWSTIVDKRTNNFPTAVPDTELGDPWTLSLGEEKTVTVSNQFQDVDYEDIANEAGEISKLFDQLGYLVWSDNPAFLSATTTDPLFNLEGKLKVKVLNPGTTSTFHYRVRDLYGGYSSIRSHKVKGAADLTRTINENSPVGTPVGDPVAGTPYDDGDDNTDDSLTYTLTGEAADSGVFGIDAATGQVSVADCGLLDYETKSSYTGKVNWTVVGVAVAANLTINVNDVDPERVCSPNAPTVTRTKFTEQSAPALDVTWSDDPGGGGTVTGYKAQYRVKVAEGETENAWTETNTLPATATTLNLPDLDPSSTYQVQIQALTTGTPSPWSASGEGRTNSTPTATSTPFNGGTFPVGSITDYNETGTGALGVFFQDEDSDALTYSVSAEHPALLGVNLSGQAGSAALRVTLLNQGISKLTYTASDLYGGRVSREATITATAKKFLNVVENTPGGTAVGETVTGTPYNGEPLTYTLTGNAKDSGKFVIDAATGQISVAEDATIDYEAPADLYIEEPSDEGLSRRGYRGSVNYTVGGYDSSIEVAILMEDVDETRPSITAITRTQFEEETAPALDVTWVAPTEPPWTVNGYNVQYRKQGDTPWTAYSGTLSATATTVNLAGLEAGATYEVQVQAVSSDEGEGPWSEIGSGTANNPPVLNPAAPRPRGERGLDHVTLRLYGDYLGGQPDHPTLPTQSYFLDEDGDALIYSSFAEHPGILSVSIQEDPSDLRLMQFLNPATTTLTAAASDGYGGYVARAAPITARDPQTRSVLENSPEGTPVGDPVTGTPYDDGDDQTDDSLTYSLTDGTNGDATSAFVMDATTGQVSVKQGATLDYETKNSYTGQVNWTVQGQAAAADLTIIVTDVTGPATPGAPSVSRHSASPRSALSVSWAAPNDNGSPITDYDVQYRRGSSGGWSDQSHSGTGTSTTINGLSSGTSYQVQVRATNAEGTSAWSSPGTGSTRSRPDNNDSNPDPRPEPTPEPTPAPTPAPTPESTPKPTPGATPEPTPGITPEPTPGPTPPPATPGPTLPPTATPVPTLAPTIVPTVQPTLPPTPRPDDDNRREPTPTLPPALGTSPTPGPTVGPTPVPTANPTTPPDNGNPTPAPGDGDNPPDSTPPPGGDTDPGSTEGTDDSGATSQLGGPPSQPKLAEGQTLSGLQQPPAPPSAFTSPRQLLSALPIGTLGSVTLPQEMANLAGGTSGPASAAPGGDGHGTTDVNALAAASGATTVTTTTTTTDTTRSGETAGGATETRTTGGAVGSSMWERVSSDYGLSSPWPWLFLLLALVVALSWMWIKRVRERWIRQRWA